MDSPARALSSLGLDQDAVDFIREARRVNDAAMVEDLATDDLLRRYQVAGTPAECAAEVAELADEHRLHAVLIDALSADLDENRSIIRDSLPIIRGTLS